MQTALPAIVLASSVLASSVLVSAWAVAQEDLYRTAEAALGERRWAEAEELFRDLVARQPGLVDGYRGLARSLAGQERRAEAAEVLGGLGAGLLEAGRHGDAVDVLGEAVELDPASARCQGLLGKAHLFEQNHLAAAAPLESALELGDRTEPTRLYLAAAYWETGRPGEAETIYQGLAEERPDAFLAVHQLGRLLLWQGRAAEAVPWLERAARQRPAAADVALDLSRALAAADEHDAALAAYRRAVELSPGSFKAHYGLARVFSRLGESEAAREAMATYQRLYAAEQERTRRESLERARLDRGWQLLEDEDYEGAARHFAGLDESAEALAGQASASSRLGDHRRAVELLEKAVSLAPERQDLRLMLAEERMAVDRR